MVMHAYVKSNDSSLHNWWFGLVLCQLLHIRFKRRVIHCTNSNYVCTCFADDYNNNRNTIKMERSIFFSPSQISVFFAGYHGIGKHHLDTYFSPLVQPAYYTRSSWVYIKHCAFTAVHVCYCSHLLKTFRTIWNFWMWTVNQIKVIRKFSSVKLFDSIPIWSSWVHLLTSFAINFFSSKSAHFS